MNFKVRGYKDQDLDKMIEIWNEVVEEGIAFPQENTLDEVSGERFFSSQIYCGVAELDNGEIAGLYILHPNNEGRVGHISNASYAIFSKYRNQHIGKELVKDSLKQAKEHGFKIMQFNAVVKTNKSARHLYEKLGFKPLGIIPDGFRLKDNSFVDICPYYFDLRDLN